MYAVTCFPLLSRTLQVLRSPELGFLGFVVPTRRQTPAISGRMVRAGEVFLRAGCGLRQCLSTWLYVAGLDGVIVNERVLLDVKVDFNGETLTASRRRMRHSGERAGRARRRWKLVGGIFERWSRRLLLRSCVVANGRIST